MATAYIWVPIIGTGKDGDYFRPDIPRGVAMNTHCGFVAGVGTGRPAHAYLNIEVDAADVARCVARIPEANVPEYDKTLTAFARHCRGDMTKAAEFFESIPAAASEKSPRAAMLAAVIEQAEARLAKTHGAITAKAVADNIAKKLNAHVARAEKKAARS